MKLIESWHKDGVEEIDAWFSTPYHVDAFMDSFEELASRYRNIREYGDMALQEYVANNRGDPRSLVWQVDRSEQRRRLAELDPAYMKALWKVRRDITAFHRRQIPTSWHTTGPHVELTGQQFVPIEKITICLPKDWAFSPVSLMMFLQPPRVAGVKKIYLNIPPPSSGTLDPLCFWLADRLGVDKVFSLPEAAAIFAFTIGTETVPQVDKMIVEGSTLAESAALMVSQDVGIKLLSAANDTVIIADNTANPAYIVADIVCLTEDPALNRVALITPSLITANEIIEELSAGGHSTVRSGPSHARTTLEHAGAIILTRTLEEAAELVNRYPPKHLNLFVHQPLDLLSDLCGAGVICLSEYTPAALDAYMAFAGNLSPASRALRFSSPLGVSDFMVRCSLVSFSKRKLASVAQTLDVLAQHEDRPYHYRSIHARL